MNSTTAINGKVACFDVVISIADEFPYLVGEVNAVDKQYATEHNLGHLYDEVFVDFRSEEYSELRRKEIESHFGQRFDRISLDNVPMAPDLLIVVPERDIPQLLEIRESAEAYCKAILDSVIDPETELIARVEQNYADFKQSLDGFSKSELIDMAAVIHAYSDAWSYMTVYHAFSDEEIQFYRQFQNPLEVVADAWRKRNIDQEDMSYTMDFVYEQKEQHLTQYALVSGDNTLDDTDLRRFMDVDVLDFLGKIAEKVIVHHPNDWNIDKEHLQRAAASDNPEDRRLMWHVSSYGTHMNTERETFIKDTGAFNTWVDYRANEPDMFGYVIEVTGKSGDVITGNVFEVGDYYPHTLHVKENALIFTEVSLTYSNDWGINAGKTVMVPRFEYNDDRHRLMSESGNVTAIQYHPYEVVRTMSDVLQQERSRRMAYPIGSQSAHLKILSDKLAEIRQPPEQEKPVPTKEKSAFDRALNRGKEKTEAYKAQKPTGQKNKQEVIE